MDASCTAPQPPKLEHMHHCSRRFGILHGVQKAEDCQIACIGKREVVLPADLQLKPWLSKYIGIVKIDDQHYVQDFSEMA